MDSEGPFEIIIKLLIVLLLILFNGFLTSVYTSLISLNHQKLRDRVDEGDNKAKELIDISSDHTRLMQTFEFVDLFISLITIFTILEAFDKSWDSLFNQNGMFTRIILTLVIVSIYVVIKMIFTNKIPQRIGVRNPYALSSNTIGFSKIILTLNSPFLKIISAITSFFMNMFGIEAKVIEKEVTSEQIKSIVQVGEDQGILRPLESKMIHSIMGFDDVWAEEVMTARTDVFMIDIQDEDKKFLDEFVKVKHSRIPVYDGEIDNILGIVYTKDYLVEACKVGLENVNIRKILKPAYFVPDKIETDKLFQDMQKNHIHLALLIDEYGGFTGIVSMEDLIEEIVGDIDDLFDNDLPEIRRSKNGVYTVKGSTTIKDINEKIPIEIDEEDYNFDTIGGFLINQLGYVPKDGANQTIIFNGYELKILYIEDARIKAVRIRKVEEN